MCKRNQLGLLIQGSVQPPLPLKREQFEQNMKLVAARDFGVAWADFEPDAELRKHVAKLASEKFSQVCYNQK